MKAIILAAGLGSRIGEQTRTMPKCLLPLHGKPVLAYQIALLKSYGIDQVTVTLGHQAEIIRDAMGDRVDYAHYPGYANTNNLYTLHHCRHLLDGDCVILFADVLLQASAFGRLIESEADYTLLVDTTCCREGTMRIRLEEAGVTDLGGHIPVPDGDGNFIGIAKYSADGAAAIAGEMDAMVREGGHEQDYYIRTLPRLVERGARVTPVEVTGRWLEIDTREDYAIAQAENFYMGRES